MVDIMNINPVPLRISRFDGYICEGAKTTPPRRVYDFEIELFIRSEGGINIDGRLVRYKPGDICVRKPGMQVYGVLPYSCYLVCFDLYGDYKKSTGYLLGDGTHAQPPETLKLFRRCRSGYPPPRARSRVSWLSRCIKRRCLKPSIAGCAQNRC